MKRDVFIFFVYLYFFLLVGLIFHTSSHPQLFGKYTLRYFLFLISILFLFFPYLQFLYFSKESTKIKIGHKFFKISPYHKIIVYIGLLIIVLFVGEIFLRVNNIRSLVSAEEVGYKSFRPQNFHPFLQNQNVQNDNERFPDFHINSSGFRGDEIKKSKEEGVYRVFLLGGSTVLNRPVPYKKTSGAILQKMLQNKYPEKKIEVLNAGVEYYTSEHSLIDYMFNIRDFNPDLIIMWHGINDMESSCSPNYISEGKFQLDYSHRYGSIINMVNYYYKTPSILNSIILNYLLHLAKTTLYSDLTSTYSGIHKSETLKPIRMDFPSIESYKRNLLYMVKFTKADNVSLLLGNQPYFYSKESDKEWKGAWYVASHCIKNNNYPDITSLIDGIKEFNKITQSIALENNIPFVDLESSIPKTSRYFIDDVHFEDNGNKIIADELYKTIVENNLILNLGLTRF